MDIFTLLYPFSSLSPSLWETTRYRLKYCVKGSLSPKTTKKFFIERPLKTGRIISCPPSGRPPVNVSCPLHNSDTVPDIFMRIGTNINHNQTMYGGCLDIFISSIVYLLSRPPPGCEMVLGKLPVLERPTIWMTVGQGPTALAVGADGSCLDIFTLIYPFSPFSPSLWETARYRLNYRLKGPLNPKQPTNQLSNNLKKS